MSEKDQQYCAHNFDKILIQMHRCNFLPRTYEMRGCHSGGFTFGMWLAVALMHWFIVK